MEQYISLQWAAFPDATMTCIDQFATENRVATEIELAGTNTGPPTTTGGAILLIGKRVTIRFASIHGIENGLAVSEHVYAANLNS